MPQHFSEQESMRIRQQLMQVSLKLFRQYGIKKTSIDRIVQDAGIAKGSFYRFFPSKEELYLAIFEELEKSMRESIAKDLENTTFESLHAEMVFTLQKQFEAVDREPLFVKLMDPEEMSYLFRKVGPERMADHSSLDDSYIEQLLSIWKTKGLKLKVSETLAIESIKSLIYIYMQKEHIGMAFNQVFQFYIESLIHGISGE
jgi:AcrR family transcriptional regulator